MDRLSEWSTKQEIAEYLRLSIRTLERRISAGLLRARKDGHLVRIKKEWVQEYERMLQQAS
jgi:excisionase family DNA binding protein